MGTAAVVDQPAAQPNRAIRWCTSVFLLIASTLCAATPADQGRPPNIVLIVSDDRAWTDYGFMGHPEIRTAHLDRLASHSAVFTRGYVPTALCRPSLATLVTGLYARSKQSPYEGGVRQPILLSWRGVITPGRRSELVSSIDLVPTILSAAGVAVPDNLPGVDLLPLLHDRAPLERDTIFGETFAHDIADLEKPEASLMYRWAIEGRWKLVLTYDGPAGRHARLFQHGIAAIRGPTTEVNHDFICTRQRTDSQPYRAAIGRCAQLQLHRAEAREKTIEAGVRTRPCPPAWRALE